MQHKGPHLLTKIVLGKKQDYILYKCTLKGCTHTIDPKLLVGRETLCNSCDIPFTIEVSTDLIIKLKCPTCRKREDVSMEQVEEVIERLK